MNPSQSTNNDNYPDKNISTNLSSDFEIVDIVQATGINNSYIFNEPYVHKQSRGFLGFSTIQTRDNLRSIITEVENKLNTVYYFMYPYKNTVKTNSGTKISENISKYTISNMGTKRYFLRQDSLIVTDALKGISAKISYSSYDSDRNPQTIKTDYGNGITNTQSLTYIKKGSYFLNKIASIQVTQKASGQPDVTRKEHFFYDNKGNLILNTKDSTHVNKVQTFYGNYDSYGNPRKITIITNGVSRSQTLTYSSSGRFVKVRKNDQFNDSTVYNYNESKGLLTSETSRLGITSYQYDNFGRIILTTHPDGIKTAHTLQWVGTISGKPTNAKYYAYTETSGQPPVIVWYDASGREIRKDSYGLNKQKIFIDTEYNSKGQVYRVSEPYFEGAAKTWAATHTYDSYGRIQYMVTPMGTIGYNYSGLTTTVTTPVDTKKTVTNAAGWVTEEETNGKKVTFTHYASGLVKTAAPEGGQVLTMEYDLQGNRTKLTDPDAGIITSLYDGWGQLIREAQKVHVTTDSIVTVYNYLSSGLLNYKLRNGENTNYSYDNLHRLQQVSITGKHTQSYLYDQWDRITQTTDVVDYKTFVSKTDYDGLRRVYRETYPGGYVVSSLYDKYGYLTRVADNQGREIWQALESNAKGQLTKTKAGDKETVFGFDNKGFPVSIVTPGITNWSYIFNSKGNLVSRKDGVTNYKDSLTYDAMNRLTAWNVYWGNNQQQTNSLTYNPATGNIQNKSDLGGYTMNYGANGKPHALTSISGVPDVIPQNNQIIAYTDFKKVRNITEGNNTLTINYGIDEQRIKSVLTKSGSSLTRYYMGNYEEEIRNGNARKIHYINGGNGLAAIYVQNNGNDSLYYVHTDHQGSLTALSLPNGMVKERYAYDLWGNRRNPSNWTQRDMRTAFLFHRGYTMHEHLPEFNLINMNGRVYDPLTAQFFSPDPYVQAPGNWLNYNRYAYCWNNPMLYTDPSGEFLGLFMRAMVFYGDLLSNLIHGHGGNDPIGNSWKHSGQVVNGFAGCAQIPVYSSDNTRITVGLDPLALGVSANVTHKSGNATVSGSFGIGLLSGPYANVGASYSAGDLNLSAGAGVGNNYWGWNASATYDGYGLGYGRTYYGASEVMGQQFGPQKLGTWTAYFNHNSFSISNDLWGDKEDRWRTNSAQLTIGDFSIGTYLYTNFGKQDSHSQVDYTEECVPPILGRHFFGNKNNYGTWTNGRVYFAPLWLGYKVGNHISRIGYSHTMVHNFTQNLAHAFGTQNYYMNYDDFRSGMYLYSGYYSPFSLWDK